MDRRPERARIVTPYAPAPVPPLERIVTMGTRHHPAPAGHYRTSPRRYAAALAAAWDSRPEIAAALTDYRNPADIPTGAKPYVSPDNLSGVIVTRDGEIIGLWSATRGRGDDLVRTALYAGGHRLDCFDGYLPALYARHGFTETHRAPNWTAGGPDVVWMTRG
jgi:hypothetical protein